MSALVRDAPVGQIIRYLTKNRLFKYPEEEEGYQLPENYQQFRANRPAPQPKPEPTPTEVEKDAEKRAEDDSDDAASLDHTRTAADHESMAASDRTLSKIMTRPSLNQVNTRADLEAAYSNATRQETLQKEPSRAIAPQVTADGVVLVDWYSTDDQENPQNWSSRKKTIVVLQIYFYTLAVYMGSAIFTPSEPFIVEKMGISPNVAALGLSMYVLGYGIGPLIWSPLSEIPVIGRNPPYMVTLGIYVALCIPTALVSSFPGLVVLRFLQGFFGSPCLATGGASIGDIFSLLKLPYFLTGWAAFATAGPALGPIISGFSVPATNWHWSLWEILWMAGPVYISLLFLLPETSSANILLRRAARLRKLTGNANLKSQGEIDQEKLTVNEVIIGNLWRPAQINILDPAVLFTSLYTALMYSIFYSFFEVFPLVYATGNPGKATHGYGMNLGEIGLIFLSISVGVSIAIALYVAYLYWIFEPEVRTRGLGEPERRLIPALPATLLLPIGLFWFAWTGNNSPQIHWIVPTVSSPHTLIIHYLCSWMLTLCLK
jgi:MFS transporter, DHA1 family, multidrug resistance protein